jgi:hypothetical protein
MIMQQFIELANGYLIELQPDDNLPTSGVTGHKAVAYVYGCLIGRLIVFPLFLHWGICLIVCVFHGTSFTLCFSQNVMR